MSKTLPAPGTRDFLPTDVRKRQYVINTIKEVYESFGFEPLETPAMENLETLMGSFDEEERKLIFKILKRGEKLNIDDKELADLALRYDLTVPLARVVMGHRNELPKFFKRYQIQPVWRADRHGRGRYKEFYQCDVDVVGSASISVEAELCQAVSEVMARLGFGDFAIRLNHRKVLAEILNKAGVPVERHRAALVAIDKLDKIGLEGLEKEFAAREFSDGTSKELLKFFAEAKALPLRAGDINPTTLNYLAETIGDEFLLELKQILRLAPLVPIILDPSLSRGLGYYTGAIMEVDLGKDIGSAGGGGRYDDLTKKFGKEQIPACGISLGLERILVLMEERGMFPPELQNSSADVMVTIWNEESVADSLALAQELRAQGLRVLLYPEADKIGKQFSYASQINVPYVIVQGDEEKANGTVTLKNMQSGEQETVKPEDAGEKIRQK